MDYKALQKLAKACRAAGIKHFKNADMEFTLSDEGPVSNYKRRTSVPETTAEDDIKVESTLSDEALLFWSTVDMPTESEDSKEN